MGNSIKRLLSFAIAMVMVLGMVPFNSLSVYAAEEAVAITTEAALQAALESSGNVTLGSDVDVATSLNIAAGVEITLDLAGHKIIGGFNGSSTTNHIYVLNNYGKLTVKDSVGNGAIVSRGVYNYGELTLESGAIDSCDGNGGYAVNNQSGSTFVMNGGTVSASYEDDHQDSSGGYDATALKVPAGCTATLNGGTVTSVTDFTYAIDAKGTLNIPADSTVTVQGNHGAIAVGSGTTTINGGTFKVIADEYARTDNVMYVSGGQLVINGGNFIGDSDIPAGGSCVCDSVGTATINGGNFSGSSGGDVWGTTGTVINGGNFENLAETSHVAVGATIVNKGKTYTMTENGLEEVTGAARIGNAYYETLAAAVANAKEGDTITILAGTLSEGTIKLPVSLKDVTFKGETGAILKDMTIMASDGNTFNYQGLTFDGIVFENSRIVITGWRTGEVTIKDLTVTNCTFQNLNDTTNNAPLHINLDASDAVENFTFTNNVIDGATGGSKSGVYAQTTGETVFTGNTINNVSFRPYVIQITTDDGIADEFTVTGNTFSGSAAGRAQGLGNNDEGTDTVKVVVSENIFKDITNSQQICYWNFNDETTTADLSKNYYDIDILSNPSRIYYNGAAENVEDLAEKGIFPYYADEDMTTLVEDPTIAAAVAQTKDAQGNVIGAYADFETAIAAAVADTTVARIEILANIAQETLAVPGETYCLTANHALTIGAPEGAQYTITLPRTTGTSLSIYMYDSGASLTIEENVTIEGLDIAATGFYTSNNSLVIEGGLKALSLKVWTSNDGIVVTETGSVWLGYGDGQLDMNYGSGYMTVNGTLTGTADLTGIAPQVQAGYTTTQNYGNGNTLNLNNTYFEGGAWFNINGKNGTFNVNNSALKVSGGSLAVKSSGNAINLTNGSRLMVANITLDAGNTITLDATSTVEATAITGAGTIVIDATGLTAGAFTNITGNLSGFTGAVTVINNNTLTASIEDGKIVLKSTADVAAIGNTGYATLQGAVDAAQDGDTIELLADVSLEDTLIIDKVGAVTINGNGKTITLADSFENKNAWGAAIMIGNSGYGDSEVIKHTVTIQNVNFEGITGNSILRVQGVTLNIDGCTVTNCDSTNTDQGMLRIDSAFTTIENTQFSGNKAAKIIGHNHNTSGSSTGMAIDDCVFANNTINGNGVIVLSSDAGCAINGSTFEANNVTCTNGATVYMGFSENNVITGNLFKDNVVTGNASSNRIAGALFVGFTNEISGNAFVNNTATNASGVAANDVCIDTVYALPNYGYALDIDISDNYFDGVAPVKGDHYTVNSEVESAYSINNYYTEYSMSGNGVVLSEQVVLVAPERPTATVTQIKNKDLTFALNFKADDATDEQLAFYGDWYADYVLTVNKDITFNADGSADGWLSGQYDEWSENWVNVPFSNVTLQAGQSLKIMEYAAELMNKKGLKYTYAEVYEAVKDFDCGVYLDPEYIAANPDLEITLELRMYNNNDETESYAIGETYVYTIPGLPTATVTKIKNKDLTFALNFKADDATDEQLYFYGDWYADYVLTVNKDITFNADGSADGWLSGQYDAWSENWVNVPFSNVTLQAGQSLKIMEYAAELMNKKGLKYTYAEVYEFVKDFDCGVYLDPEFIKANPDLEITLELRAFNNKDESVSYVIGETYVYTIPGLPTATVTKIKNEDLTFALNFKADDATEEQLYFYGDWYADYVLTVNKDITFNADGSADGWLSGQYDAWSENWVNVPFSNVTLQAGQSLKIMEYAAELMNKKGLKYTYAEVYEAVKDFDCGVYLDPEFIKANRDLEITLELRMYNNNDETESYTIGETYVYTIPGLPTATVTQIENEDLTFALNFKADDATEEQLYFYGDWYADYVLTVNKDITFNADGSADGWLSGQYDEWSENWVNVPFSNVTLAAGESLKIMEYAAELMNKKGLKYTYAEVYEAVKDFDCGVYLDPEFIKANRDLEITLELRMYNNEDETENYVIGETYVFTIPGLPTATVTEIENEDLTFALNFVADEATEEQLYFYGDWYADYVLTVNKDITLNADGSADGWLSGQYDEWSENWVNVPFSNVTLAAGESLKIMEYAAELMNKKGLKYTYAEVYEAVKDFDCGMFLDDEFIAANPDVEITLELRMYNNEDETESYVIGETYVFTLEQDVVAKNLQTNKTYSKVTTALSEAVEGETVQLLRSVAGEQVIVILNGITLDLNGYTLSAAHVIAASSGGHIMDNTNGNGLLEIQKSNLTLLANEQLPVWIEGEGYRFASVGFGQWTQATSSDRASAMFGFYLSGNYADYLVAKELADGAEDGDGLKIQVVMEYTNSEGSRSSLTFNPPADVVANYAKNWAVDALAMYISGLNTISEISFRAVIVSGHVTISGAAVDYVVS